METITLELENFFQLKVSVQAPGQYFAFYLYTNDELTQRTPYSPESSYKFPLDKAGVYRVKWYVKSASGEITSGLSERFRFAGFKDVPRKTPVADVAIMGITRTSAFAAHVFAVKNNVRFFVDPGGEHVGSTFFDRPVLGTEELPGDVVVIGHEGYSEDFPRLRPFSFANGAVDILSRELHRFGVMDLYRISRSAYLEGFTEGAYCIQTFIFNKYNCRVPFKARIGEGTRLGIGGIGTVIHPDSIIGRDCVIAQNVTLGGRVRGNGTPVIGNNVFIAPGAKCFGGKIGSNVVVGANSVVLDEIPDNCVVAGVPARIISRDISKYSDYIARPPR